MGIKPAVSAAFACISYLDDNLFQGGYFNVLVLHSPGPEIVHYDKITHLNLSHKFSLCQVTSFFWIWGPVHYLLCSVKRRSVSYFQYITTNTTFITQNSWPFFPPELALWILCSCVTWAEIIITKGLSWESFFGSKAWCSSNENCRSSACQSMARAAQRLPHVLVAVSSARITIPA